MRDRLLLVAGLLLGAACGSTSHDGDDDAAGEGEGEGEGEDPCADVLCAPRTECIAGACVGADPCADVTCDEGLTCSAGTCVNAALDEDDDGYAAATDCDDHDPDVFPGSAEPCASDCGEGTTTCEAGEWLPCTAPEECDCLPGEARPEPCGQCGVALRACGADGTWDPEAGDCEGEGECSAGAVEVAACGSECARQSRTCADDCTWEPFGACVGNTECDPGDLEPRACGDCGTQERACTDQCLWGAFGACSGGGVCSPGAQESLPCGPADCGQQTRTCTAQCDWGAFGQCVGLCTQLCGDITADAVINYEDYEFCLGHFPNGQLDPNTPCCMRYVIDTDLDGNPEESDCERIGAWWLQGNDRPPWQCG